MVYILKSLKEIVESRGEDLDSYEEYTHIQQDPAFREEEEILQGVMGVMKPYTRFSQHYPWAPKVSGTFTIFTDAFVNAGM